MIMKPEAGGTKSRVLSLLLKTCNLVEVTCQLGTAATQSLVECLEESHRSSGNRVKKAVTATLLKHSSSTCRLAELVSDELTSILWWPRMGVELYEVRWLHFLVLCRLVLFSEPPSHFLCLTGTSNRSFRGLSENAPSLRCSASINSRSQEGQKEHVPHCLAC